MHIAEVKLGMAETSSALQAEWVRLRAIILKAIPCLGGTHDEADLIAGCLSGQFTLWTAADAFVLATVQEFPRLKRLHIFLANGNPQQVNRLMVMASAWSKAKGVSEITCTLRPAVERHNERHPEERISSGWKKTGATYVKEI